MLTSLLRSNTILGFLLSWIFVVVMIAVPFTQVPTESLSTDFLYSHWAFGWLKDGGAVLPWMCIALIVGATVLGRLRTRETKSVLGDRSLVAVAFVSIVMTQPRAAFARPDVLVALVLLMALFLLLMYTYKLESVLSEMFHTGLLLGLASIFVGQSILMVLSLTFGFLMLRTGNWREWAVLFLGLAMVVVFIFLVTIWDEAPFLEFKRVVQSAWLGSWTIDKPSSGHIALLLATVVSVGGILGGTTTGTVAERNILLTNVGWLIGVSLMTILLGLGWQNGIILAAFPLSSMMVRTLERISRWWLADLLLLTILSAPFLSSLWPL
jgi:hypothetical protein